MTVQSGLGYYLHLEPKGLKETMQEKNSDIFDIVNAAVPVKKLGKVFK